MTKRRGKKRERTRAIGYIRVSTDKQAEKGISLAAQRAKLAAYADLYDVELVRIEQDRESAKTLDRPGLRRALDALKAGDADALLIVRLDRLTRSVRDLGELVTKHFGPGKSELLSVGEHVDTRSAGGRLVLNVLASVCQWQREAIGEHTSQAMRHKASVGEFTGGPAAPFGFRLAKDGVRLLAAPREQAVLARARELRASGLSLRDVAAELEAEGHRGRGRTPISHTKIRRWCAERPVDSNPEVAS